MNKSTNQTVNCNTGKTKANFFAGIFQLVTVAFFELKEIHNKVEMVIIPNVMGKFYHMKVIIVICKDYFEIGVRVIVK